MQIPAQLLSRSAPIANKQRAYAKGPAYDGVVIPRNLADWSANMRGVGGLRKPNRPMVNFVARELAIEKLKAPSYTPFIAPNMADGPCPEPSSDHKAMSRNGTQIAKLPSLLVHRRVLWTPGSYIRFASLLQRIFVAIGARSVELPPRCIIFDRAPYSYY